MKNKEDGTLDHSSFPSYSQKEVEGKTKEGISLSSQMKYSIKATQELSDYIKELEQRIIVLEKEM